MRAALHEAVRASLPQSHEKHALNEFYRLIRDYPERGGKGLRGLLVLLSTGAHGADWRRGLEVAAALELFQNWVLVHDDIEDDSEERRGAPALHKQVGMPVALNVGDALHVYMWQKLHALERPTNVWREILREFAWMIQRTAEGQHLDLSWISAGRFDVSEAEYLEMVTLKTAYYTVVCPLRLGGFCAGTTPDARLTEAGKELGIAFQIRDDVLNLLPEVAYGKEFAGDLYEAKRTLVLSHLFSHAGADKGELEALLAKPRGEKTEEDVQTLLAAIDRHGSLFYAQEVAERSAAEGTALLQEVLYDLPGKREVGELTGLLESLASRKL